MNKILLKNEIRSFPNIECQGGWTFWSLGFTLLVIGFFAYVGMQLVPIYSTNANLENAMTRSLDSAQNLRNVKRAQIVNQINKQLSLDGSYSEIDLNNNLELKRSRSKLIMQVKYERTVPLFSNISVLASFNPKFECDFNGNCEKQ